MPQAAFSYDAPANDADGLTLAVSLFADRAHVRGLMRDDAAAAGFRIAGEAGMADLAEGGARPLGDVVLVDCPRIDGTTLAALSRLDMRAARNLSCRPAWRRSTMFLPASISRGRKFLSIQVGRTA